MISIYIAWDVKWSQDFVCSLQIVYTTSHIPLYITTVLYCYMRYSILTVYLDVADGLMLAKHSASKTLRLWRATCACIGAGQMDAYQNRNKLFYSIFHQIRHNCLGRVWKWEKKKIKILSFRWSSFGFGQPYIENDFDWIVDTHMQPTSDSFARRCDYFSKHCDKHVKFWSSSLRYCIFAIQTNSIQPKCIWCTHWTRTAIEFILSRYVV